MKKSEISRKDFFKKSGLGLMGAIFIPELPRTARILTQGRVYEKKQQQWVIVF